MEDLFDMEYAQKQRARLVAERDRICNAIEKLDEFLAAMGQFPPGLTGEVQSVTLTEAIRRICFEKKSSITKGFLIKALAEQYPRLSANESSVAAILASMAKSNPPSLYIEIRGSGRRAAEYGIEEPRRLKLNETEEGILMDPERLAGTGGWQSLFSKIQNNYDESEKELIFPDSLKEQIRHYYTHYGVGGYQSHLKKALGLHVPELFQ